jgi:NADH-quinone oxidoreductase subunit A
MTPLAAYLLLFVAVGVGFILVHLLLGKLIRPDRPDAEKDTIYECGEPTIGSAWIQFDLRYYVVALLFVIFDVEVAFFFPWAEVFGKANAVANLKKPQTAEEYKEYARRMLDLARPASSDPNTVAKHVEEYRKIAELTPAGLEALRKEQQRVKAEVKEKGEKATLTAEELRQVMRDGPLARTEFEDNRNAAWGLAAAALIEVLVFFGVLLVGFAYLWRRGDLQWVRSTNTAEEAVAARAEVPEPVGAGAKG